MAQSVVMPTSPRTTLSVTVEELEELQAALDIRMRALAKVVLRDDASPAARAEAKRRGELDNELFKTIEAEIESLEVIGSTVDVLDASSTQVDDDPELIDADGVDRERTNVT